MRIRVEKIGVSLEIYAVLLRGEMTRLSTASSSVRRFPSFFAPPDERAGPASTWIAHTQVSGVVASVKRSLGRSTRRMLRCSASCESRASQPRDRTIVINLRGLSISSWFHANPDYVLQHNWKIFLLKIFAVKLLIIRVDRTYRYAYVLCPNFF